MKTTHSFTISFPLIFIAIFNLLIAVSCAKVGSTLGGNITGGISTNSNTIVATPATSAALTVRNTAQTAVFYTDTGTTRNFPLHATTSYHLSVSTANLPSGSSIQASILDTSLPNQVAQTQILNSSGMTFTPSIAGDYTITISVMSSNGTVLLSKNYSANVFCASPTFTADSLIPSALSVSGSNGNYTYDASGVVATANGEGPYQCAYDFTGTGMVESAFSPCVTPVNSFSMAVGNRNVGVIVKDACNTSYTISNGVTLAYAIPASPGSKFMSGIATNESGIASTDPRTSQLQFFGANPPAYNSMVGADYYGSSFYVQSISTYYQANSVYNGLELLIGNIGGTFDIDSAPNGNIDMTNAVVDWARFYTDQVGDAAPQLGFGSAGCNPSALNARVINLVLNPCPPGDTGTLNTATVEFWGNYSCTNLSTTGGAFDMAGSFDATSNIADRCIPPAPPATPTPIPVNL